MAHTSVKISTALLVAIVLGFPSAAGAVNASKIILQDGTVYEDVAFLVESAYKVLTITKDDWERTVSFTDIAYIYNSKGEDVTVNHLGMVYRKTDSIPPPPETGTSPAAQTTLGDSGLTMPANLEQPAVKRQLHPWDVAVRVGGNFSMPTSDFYEGFTSGFGFEGDVIIPAAKNLAVRLSVSKSGIKDDPERLFEFAGSPLELIEDNASAQVLRFVVAAEYYEWPKWREGGRWMYHIYSGAGVANHSMSGEYVVRDTQSGEYAVLVPSKKDLARFMLVLGFGAMTTINKNVGLEGALEMDAVAIGSNPDAYSVYSAVDYAFVFDFKLGLVFLF